MRAKLALALLAVALAFTLLGARPIWEADEGRYSNVALHMLESGDWLHPMRNHEQGHWTKPPLTYWAIASAVAAFGYTPWAARLPVALAYLACVWLSGRLTRRLAPGRETQASLAFMTMGLPLAAAQWLTTDFLLTAFEALAMWGFVEARFGAEPTRRRWLSVMWLGFALAFLTKGPPALLPLLAVLAFNALATGASRLRLLMVPGPWLFLVLGFSWYAAVVIDQPALLGYFLGKEVVERVAGDGFNRNGQWYGWLVVYGPTLLLGTLPWSTRLWRWLASLQGTLKPWWQAGRPATDDAARPALLILWVLLPLLVFCLARSRLPLYLLPLFVPLAIAAASVDDKPVARRWLALVIGLVLAVRVAVLFLPTHKNAEAWATQIRQRVDFPVQHVVFVDDMARYGLHLHLGAEVEKVTLAASAGPLALDDERGHSLAIELREGDPHVLYITKQAQWPAVQAAVRAEGRVPVLHGQPFMGRVFFTAAVISGTR